MTSYHIEAARDGGFVIRQETGVSKAEYGPIVFAGSLSACLGYLRRRLREVPK